MCTSLFGLVPGCKSWTWGTNTSKEASRTQEETQVIKDEVYKRSYTAVQVTRIFGVPDGPAHDAGWSGVKELVKKRTSRPGMKKCAGQSGEERRTVQYHTPDCPATIARRSDATPDAITRG